MARAMCGRARLSSDVSEIKLVFSIPPHRPTPNIARTRNGRLGKSTFWKITKSVGKDGFWKISVCLLLPKTCLNSKGEIIFPMEGYFARFCP
jgi:hypothetical protein